MIEKHLLEELLGIAVSTGADFAEEMKTAANRYVLTFVGLPLGL